MIDLNAFARLAGSSREDRVYGVVIGTVTNTADPAGLNRVKLRLPSVSEAHESNWARVVSPMAGNDRGLYLLPEVGDEVLVAFESGSVDFPYVLGALWNGKDKPPAGKSSVRMLKSYSGHIISLDDTEGEEKIEIIDAKGTESIVLDVTNKTITISADHDVTIESKDGKIKLKGKKGIEIVAEDGPAMLKANGKVDVESAAQVSVKGSAINLN